MGVNLRARVESRATLEICGGMFAEERNDSLSDEISHEIVTRAMHFRAFHSFLNGSNPWKIPGQFLYRY